MFCVHRHTFMDLRITVQFQIAALLACPFWHLEQTPNCILGQPRMYEVERVLPDHAEKIRHALFVRGGPVLLVLDLKEWKVALITCA